MALCGSEDDTTRACCVSMQSPFSFPVIYSSASDVRAYGKPGRWVECYSNLIADSLYSGHERVLDALLPLHPAHSTPDSDTRSRILLSQKTGFRVTGHHSSAQASCATWGRLQKSEGMAHMDNSVVSRCGLMGMLPSTGEACPESLLSVILSHNAFLVDTWAPSVILLPKWSQDSLHRVWITVPLKSPRKTFCILAGSSFSGHQLSSCLSGPTHSYTHSCRARAAASSHVPLMEYSFTLFLLLTCFLVPLNSGKSKRSALPFRNFVNFFF